MTSSISFGSSWGTCSSDGLDDRGGEVVGPALDQRALVRPPDGAPGGGDDDGFGHVSVPLEVAKCPIKLTCAVAGTCRKAATRRSSPPSSPTSGSPSPSSWASSSRARRRCSPRPSTRSPTPATRGSCSSAGDGPGGRPTVSTRSGTAVSATSGRSSWRWCCSPWAACSRSFEGEEKLRSPARARVAGDRDRDPRGRDRPRGVLVPHRRARSGQGAGRRLVVAVHPAQQEPRAPRRAPRGHRRADRPRHGTGGRHPRRGRPARSAGTRSGASGSASCSW